MKNKSNFRKGLEKVLVSGIMGLGGLIGSVNGDSGSLRIDNKLESEVDSNKVYIQHTFDGNPDDPWPGILAGSSIYIDNNGNQMYIDSRIENSSDPNDSIFDTNLVYNGTTTESKTNSLEFSFPYPGYEFGDKEITFSSERLPYGPVVDVRTVIANGGNLDLIPLEAGTYTNSTPYGEGNLEIGTRLLSDLNDSGRVDLVDYALLAKDWMNPVQGQYDADITGPNGIPDGFVDMYDLARFSSDWLRETGE